MTQQAAMAEGDVPAARAHAQGFDPVRLREAAASALANESEWPRSMFLPNGVFAGAAHIDDSPPYDQPLGPVFPRGGANGLVMRRGETVARWGDTRQVDMTFSVAKSYLAMLTGLAVDRGLVNSIEERVGDRVRDGGFEDQHNSAITWRHLLEQTSEWHGTLFDRPDSVDWNRRVGPLVPSGEGNARKGSARVLQAPGTHFEYNDVRVNRLGLALLRLFKEPLPAVLKREIMDPIGCSDSWQWNGYLTSWVEIEGRRMQSVPGGGHWGGGIVISAEDHARVGELIRNRGVAGGRRLLSERWIDAMLTPSRAHPSYGLLWWLNTDRALFPSLPASSVFALGAGQHVIWVDRPRELVTVLRWVHKPATDAVLGRIAQALRG
jgi:CubicO group peptidase (beta-lactamase class C family)